MRIRWLEMRLEDLAAEEYCYLTTTGRITGRSHTIEIWFALEGRTVYLLSGGGRGSDWVRNLLLAPEVTLRLRADTFRGRARIVSDPSEDERARSLVHDKYRPGYQGDLTRWRRSSLPVAVDLDGPAAR